VKHFEEFIRKYPFLAQNRPLMIDMALMLEAVMGESFKEGIEKGSEIVSKAIYENTIINKIH
jgi:hypothetical protein